MSSTMIRLATARIVQYPTDSDLVLVNNKIGISPKLVFKKTKVAIRWPRGETIFEQPDQYKRKGGIFPKSYFEL
jgi:hypothetical protein